MAKAKKVVEEAPVEAAKAETKKVKYVVVGGFTDALIPTKSYQAGDILPDDISDDRIQTMLDNKLIKAK